MSGSGDAKQAPSLLVLARALVGACGISADGTFWEFVLSEATRLEEEERMGAPITKVGISFTNSGAAFAQHDYEVDLPVGCE